MTNRMLICGRFAALWLAAAWLLTGSSSAATTSVGQVRVGAPPPQPRSARVLGALPDTTAVSILVALKPRNPAALERYASQVSMPGSSMYHDYLTVAQFRRQFGPTAAQTAAVGASLRDHGLTPGPVSANGLTIPVSAMAGAIGHAFSLSFHRVATPGGRTAFANTQAPLLASPVASLVQGVVGLDTLAVAHPLDTSVAPALGSAAGSTARPVDTGGPEPCSKAAAAAPDQDAYTANQIASAYKFSSLYGAGDEGAGQTVAVLELEPNLTSDVTAYQACYGTDATVAYTREDGGAGSGAGSGEAALDIEQLIGLAPRANVDVYQGPNSGAGLIDDYTAMVENQDAKVATTSWGLCEPDTGSSFESEENTLFEEAATQGQSIFAAAGDNGSEDCDTNALAVDDPASQPYVTGVGGTTLSSVNAPRAESVWNDAANGAGAAGGGVSSAWRMPAYQADAPASVHVLNSSSSGAPCAAPAGGNCREVPDVSADADPYTGYLIYFNGAWGGIGGTSAAAPLWAAFMALVDASSSCHGTSVGFANPALYATAASAYASNFNDITSGDNDYAGTNQGKFAAGPGYDMASGLGTPNGSSLPAALCGGAEAARNTVSASAPPNSATTVGTFISLQAQATDSGGAPTTYTASGLPAGVSISSSSGLISGAPTRAGHASVSVTATDPTGASDTASFTLIVGPGSSTALEAVRDAGTGSAWTGSETAGASAYYTAFVSGGGAIPTGTVAYAMYANRACSAAARSTQTVTVNGAGTVPSSRPTGRLAAGSYSLVARYSGDADYRPSTSACLPFIVGTKPVPRAVVARSNGGATAVSIRGARTAADGGTFSVRVTVRNEGQAATSAVKTTLLVPGGLRLTRTDRGSRHRASVAWTAGSIPIRGDRVYTVTFRVSGTAHGRVTIAATAGGSHHAVIRVRLKSRRHRATRRAG